jgi:O-Antigen ligase
VGVRSAFERESLGALVLALALPFLFLDESHQPGLELGLGSTDVTLRLSDAAVLAVLLAALSALARHGAWRLTAARIVWIPGLALLGWLGFQALRTASRRDVLFEDHLVQYVELVGFSLLAVAVPLVVRRALDLAIVAAGIALWSLAATGVAAAQALGVDVLDAGVAGARQPSFLTFHDLAALSALSLGGAAAGILASRRRIPAPALFPAALVGGALGLVLAGSVAAVAGFAVGAILALLVAHGRLAPAGPRSASLFALAALVVIVAVGVTSVRAGWAETLAERAGLSEETAASQDAGPRREVLVYLGLRVFQDAPVLGAGWQRSTTFTVVQPHLSDARKRYPDEAAGAFPAAGREIPVPSLYAQLLADAGFIALALLLALGVGGLVLCWRTAAYASVPWAAGAGLAMLCALAALAGEWALVPLVPGAPIQAATALALGLAAAGAATVEDESGG